MDLSDDAGPCRSTSCNKCITLETDVNGGGCLGDGQEVHGDLCTCLLVFL